MSDWMAGPPYNLVLDATYSHMFPFFKEHAAFANFQLDDSLHAPDLVRHACAVTAVDDNTLGSTYEALRQVWVDGGDDTIHQVDAFLTNVISQQNWDGASADLARTYLGAVKAYLVAEQKVLTSVIAAVLNYGSVIEAGIENFDQLMFAFCELSSQKQEDDDREELMRAITIITIVAGVATGGIASLPSLAGGFIATASAAAAQIVSEEEEVAAGGDWQGIVNSYVGKVQEVAEALHGKIDDITESLKIHVDTLSLDAPELQPIQKLTAKQAPA
ncbi:hypothetical protein [Amycolatopsis magusensis]|uniref:hypothetical protein n=1 Tax=Amycolatopsis magusensis TaxID=882444 RepID=UPI00378BDB7C